MWRDTVPVESTGPAMFDGDIHFMHEWASFSAVRRPAKSPLSAVVGAIRRDDRAISIAVAFLALLIVAHVAA